MDAVAAIGDLIEGNVFLKGLAKARAWTSGRLSEALPFSRRVNAMEKSAPIASAPATPAPETLAPPVPQTTETPEEPMSAAEHWSKAVTFIVESIAGARNAATLQRAASAQLDATAYALEGLYEELQAAMPVPGRSPEEVPTDVVIRMAPRPKRRSFPNVFAEKVKKTRKSPKSRKAPKTRRARKAA